MKDTIIVPAIMFMENAGMVISKGMPTMVSTIMVTVTAEEVLTHTIPIVGRTQMATAMMIS